MVSEALAAGATLVSLAFALSTGERWLARRRPHELAWKVSLVFFALGSASLWAGASLGWGEWSFRAFYLFGGILNVPFLALGTVYLLGGDRLGNRIGVGLALVAAWAAGAVTVAPLEAPVRAEGLPTGRDHFGVLPRVLAGVGSGLAATVLIVGALWSAVSLLRGRRRAPAANGSAVPAGRLAGANALIALGTIVISTKSLFEALGDDETAFAAAVATGITIIFVGFLLTNTRPRATDLGDRPAAAIPATAVSAIFGGPASACEPDAESDVAPAPSSTP